MPIHIPSLSQSQTTWDFGLDSVQLWLSPTPCSKSPPLRRWLQTSVEINTTDKSYWIQFNYLIKDKKSLLCIFVVHSLKSFIIPSLEKDQVRNKRQVVTLLVLDKGVVVTRAILVKNLLRVYIRKDFWANYLALFKIRGDNRQIIWKFLRLISWRRTKHLEHSNLYIMSFRT